jgi:hypothetical protein
MDEIKGVLNDMVEFRHRGRMRDPESLPVHIRQEGDVDNEMVNLSRSVGDEIVWISSGDPFSVYFPVSPFTTQTFDVPAGGSVSSGRPRLDAPIAQYQYFVTNLALAKSADPGVSIKP